MAKYKKASPLRRHYLAQWRESRGIDSVEKMAELLSNPAVGSGIRRESLWRVETGRSPYSQHLLEACAEVLECSPADLLTHDPSDAETLVDIFRELPDEQAERDSPDIMHD